MKFVISLHYHSTSHPRLILREAGERRKCAAPVRGPRSQGVLLGAARRRRKSRATSWDSSNENEVIL